MGVANNTNYCIIMGPTVRGTQVSAVRRKVTPLEKPLSSTAISCGSEVALTKHPFLPAKGVKKGANPKREKISAKRIATMSGGGGGGGDRPTVMVTNDDGIDAPGIRALVHVLVSSNRFNVLVCAPDSYVLLFSICDSV